MSSFPFCANYSSITALMFILIIYNALLIKGETNSVTDDEWTYEKADSWSRRYPACGGQFQSPIVIHPATAVQRRFARFNFTNYDRIVPFILNNNGHSVMLHLPATYPVDQLPSISGGGLRGRFVFSQLHFHWSSDLKRGGSEHVIYPQRYPAEMHLVHYNAKYGKMEEAVRHGDGLAVLAVFIEVSDRWGHVAFRRFVNQFDSIITEGQEVNVTQPTMLMDFLPDELGNFYRYSGSLTTPGCLEIVTWTVFDSSIAVSARQFRKFGRLIDHNGRIMDNNFRPTSPRFGRIVAYRSEDGRPLRRPQRGVAAPLTTPVQ